MKLKFNDADRRGRWEINYLGKNYNCVHLCLEGVGQVHGADEGVDFFLQKRERFS